MLLNVIFYFLSAIVIFVISCTILLYCKYKCFRENSEVGAPEQAVLPSFVAPAGVPEWVTSPRPLCMYYNFSSMYSLARETALGYIPNAAQLAGSTESVVQLRIFYLLYFIWCVFVFLSLCNLLKSMNRSLKQQVKQKNKQTKEKSAAKTSVRNQLGTQNIDK